MLQLHCSSHQGATLSPPIVSCLLVGQRQLLFQIPRWNAPMLIWWLHPSSWPCLGLTVHRHHRLHRRLGWVIFSFDRDSARVKQYAKKKKSVVLFSQPFMESWCRRMLAVATSSSAGSHQSRASVTLHLLMSSWRRSAVIGRWYRRLGRVVSVRVQPL